ncbi:general substrate transporter [Fusarium oxysporum]|nr:general substrate transporter [Fusarium oxysporum]
MKPKVYQFLVGVFASFGSLLFGYDLGVIAQVIASPSYHREFNTSDTAADTGAVVALFTAGAFFGAMFAGPTTEYTGRRWTITIGSIIFTLGGALQTGAPKISYLMAGRFLAGLGVGFLTMIIPLYQAEIAHPSIRGRVTALQQFMLGIGALVASWTGWGTFTNYSDNRQWRIPLGIQIIPAIILGAPHLRGKQDEALKTLARLHSNGNVDDAWVRAEIEQIQESIADEHANGAKSYLELFRDISCFRRLLIACGLQASIQMTGVSAIQYYSVTIYGQAGINAADTLKYQAINSIIALIAQALCIVYIDRFGRRWTLIWGNLFNMLTFIIATIMLVVYPPGSGSAAQGWGFIIPLADLSLGSSPAEIFDTRTRAKGVSLATMTSFAFNTMIGQYYLLFVICNFTNALCVWAFVPETKQLPLEEMNYLFTNAPWFIPFVDKSEYTANLQADLARRAEAIDEKLAAQHETGEHVDKI